MDPTFQMLMAALAAVPVFGPILPYVPLVCLVASILDAALPQPAAGSPWVTVRSILHVMSLGVANARPAAAAGPAAPPTAPALAAATAELGAVAVTIAADEAAAKGLIVPPTVTVPLGAAQ